MGRDHAKKLREKSVEAMERLDLPTVLASDIPRLELTGNHAFYMDRHRGVLSYTTEHIDINGGAVIVRIAGRIEKLELME